MVDEQILFADRRKAIAAMLANSLGKARIERGKLEVRPVLVDQLRQVGHAEEAAGFRRDGVGRVQPFLDLVDQGFGHTRLKLEPDHAASATALDGGAEVKREILGLFLHLDVAVADDPERAAAQDLIFGKQIAGPAPDQRFQRDVASVVARDADEARHARRSHDQLADIGLALLQLEDEAEAAVGDEGEGVRRIDRLRRQHREDLLAKVGVEPRLRLRVECLVANDMHRRLVEQGLQQRPDFVLAGNQSVRFGDDRAQLLGDGEAVHRLFFDAEHLVGLEAGDSDHEEFVEVAGRDRQEPHPLEQRVGRIRRLLEHAAIERQPAELAVEIARLGGDRGIAHDRCFRKCLHQLVTKGKAAALVIQLMSPN